MIKLIDRKKGWIKIAEAFIAVILIAAIMLTVYAGKTKTKTNENIISMEDNLLDEIVQNENYRKAIVMGDADGIKSIVDLVGAKIPAYLDFEVRICEVNDICSQDSYMDKEVYARERIVSSTLSKYYPKKLKIFVWEK